MLTSRKVKGLVLLRCERWARDISTEHDRDRVLEEIR